MSIDLDDYEMSDASVCITGIEVLDDTIWIATDDDTAIGYSKEDAAQILKHIYRWLK